MPKASQKATTMSREMQVHYVLKLLEMKGATSADQIRQRMRSGRGVVVKGLHFDSGVLNEALEKWQTSIKNSIPGQTLEPAVGSPEHAVGSPGAEGKRHLGGVRATTPQHRLRHRPSDENVNPQAVSAISRAAKEKAERRGRRLSGTPSPLGLQCPEGAGEPVAASTAQLGAEPRVQSLSEQPVKRLRRKAPSPRQAPSPATASAPAPASPSAAPSRTSRSIKELKVLLSESGLDFTGCVEKADLQALWDRFNFFRGQPLEEIRASCAASGGPCFGSADECAKFLADPPKAGGGGSGQGAPVASATPAAAEPAAENMVSIEEQMRKEETAVRERDAEREVKRIKGLNKDQFPSGAAWGFAVLDVASRDVSAVQRGYRALMRKLHPDKVGRSSDVTRAVELIREAKEACERGLSRQEPPGVPRCLKSAMVCATPGRRKFRLEWLPPEEQLSAPVRRYVIAAVDPAYGKALTITVLEPDYSEELHRFVNVEELTSYVFAEEELQKMPRLWQQSSASVQVAAANEAGQSPWANLQFPLRVFGGGAVGRGCNGSMWRNWRHSSIN